MVQEKTGSTSVNEITQITYEKVLTVVTKHTKFKCFYDSIVYVQNMKEVINDTIIINGYNDRYRKKLGKEDKSVYEVPHLSQVKWVN